ncbi:MAG: hypothetical protein JJU01_08415 [Alkalibacterium sp.]|nr:hypothetical protein [Alkalibacterium sp.]TVP93362.1 MAG: hypothetical protein EA249_00460 [Alkalibacterium sp.]
MDYEDRDYIMRQMKVMAKGIGVLLEISSLKELLKLEFSADDNLTDPEIEFVIYSARVEELLDRGFLTMGELSQALEVPEKRVENLLYNEDMATRLELEQIKRMVDEKMHWLDSNGQ